MTAGRTVTTMRPVLTTLCLLLHTATAWAHPGWGIVQDSRGNVFVTDTRQVWQIAPDGRVSVAVPDVHTHELALDAADNLYGEHLWYVGATGQWRHRVWQRRPDGSVTDVIAARDGFLSGYSFVRDRAGNMYWADRGEVTVITKRAPDGRVTTHATAGFRSVERITATAEGTLYVMDAGSLRRVTPAGTVTTLVAILSGDGADPADVARLNYHMGLWADRDQGVCVAAAAERSVLCVDEAGTVSVRARSAAPWSPSGGLIDRAGSLWILEYDTANAVRVRRVERDGRERVFTL